MPSSSLLLTFTKMPWLSAPLFLAPLPMPPTLLPVAFGHPKRTYITMLLLPVAYVINHTLSWASTPHLHWIPPLSLPTICPKDCFYFFFFFFPFFNFLILKKSKNSFSKLYFSKYKISYPLCIHVRIHFSIL
jgi:hypothetical protein